MMKWAALPVRVVMLAIAIAASIGTGSCADPVHDAEVKALGGENGGVSPGEFHRAGQPCLVCHGGLGPASKTFSIAGTIFNGPDDPMGEGQVTVELIDALGVKPPQKIVTNCVGNFFVTPETWDPAFPVLVRITKNDQSVAMNSHIGREGSCNKCHKDPISFDSPGHVYLFPADQQTPPPDCPVSPIAGIAGNPPPGNGGS